MMDLCSFVICQAIRTSIAKKPFIWVIFQEVGVEPHVPPLDPRMIKVQVTINYFTPLLLIREKSKPSKKNLIRLRPMKFSIKQHAIKVAYIEGSQVILSKNTLYFFLRRSTLS